MDKVKKLRQEIGVGQSVASELLTLSGGDLQLAAQASKESTGLDQCKAAIINERFQRIEKIL